MLKMSMFGDMKKSVKSAKAAAKDRISNALKPSTQIKSTLNDFSMVEKATLKFASINPVTDTVTVEPRNPIYVQINPNDISYNYESYSTGTNILSNIQGDARILQRSSNPFLKAKMSFTLNYDFYDEYQARSAGGSAFSLNAFSSGDGFHLANETYSSLATIIRQSRNVATYVLFKWGPLEHFGQLETVSPHYTAFSPSGQPLKGYATVDMNIFYDNNDADEMIKEGHLLTIYNALTEKNLLSKTDKLGKMLGKAGSTIKALR